MFMLVQKTESKKVLMLFITKKGKVLFFFEEQSDAERYAMMLETENDEPVEPVEVDPDLAIKTCIVKGVNYVVITKDDLVVPPLSSMILFENIRWKNFLSTGDQWTEIDFTQSNNTIIIGSNGSGKSTLLDALTFACSINLFVKSINHNLSIQLMKRTVLWK